MKKRILCYGDSNTWGYMPEGQPDGFHMRYPEEVRWTGVLQRELGDDFVVIEEGLNGRTTSFDEEGFRSRNGLSLLEGSLLTHEPMDVVVIALGTNDLKPYICGNPYKSAESVGSLVRVAQTLPLGKEGSSPKVLLVAPPHLGPGILKPPFAAEFDGQASIEASKEMGKAYRRVADRLGAGFLDASEHATVGKDGLHLPPASHASLGKAIASKVREMTD